MKLKVIDEYIYRNDYDSIKDFVYQYFEDEDHYNLIHKIIIK